VRRPHGYIALLAATGALLVTGCGGSNDTTTKSTSSAASNTGYSEGQTTSSAATTPTTGSSATTTAGSGVVITAKHDKLGTILAAGPKKLTVYLFEGDKGQGSSCTGACAQVWPPVTTGGAPTTSGSAMAGELGTITRSDGTTQVTYKGHPLYFYAHDKDDGDAYGEGINGFGASWYVIKPSGAKVDDS
jgi:predicted lipoprotein with Yx(FWY)xxD motif